MVGSVQAIRPAELKVPSTNLSNSFAGRLSGVVAVQRTGRPGADGSDFWIRGISTLSEATSPLIIIDGVQVSSADLNALDPEVIDGFSILKDATATAMYGTRGANGVMLEIRLFLKSYMVSDLRSNIRTGTSLSSSRE